MSADGSLVHLPGVPIGVSPLGLGTWAWGDESTWGMGGYDTALTETTIAAAFETSVAAGVRLIDTAEVYGGGESERIIGRLLASSGVERSDVVIATKFMPMPWKLNVRSALRSACEGSLTRLGVDEIDLYQLHGPISLRSLGALADALADVHESGLVRSVGVSNYSERETRSMHASLASHGVPLATNQIEMSLLRRRPETTGLLAACAELGVVPLAYSPIGQGRLTGKYSASNPPPKGRNFSAHPMAAVDLVVAELRQVADEISSSRGVEPPTPAQVALAWLITKGTIPIPGAKNAEQAAQNAGALHHPLDADQVATLDRVALSGTRTLANRFWQHG